MKRIITLLVLLSGLSLVAWAQPTTQAINITFPTANFLQDGTGYRVQWTNGNGARRIVVGRQGADPNTNPVNATGTYTANAAFGTPAAQLGTGNYIVYDGTGNNVDVTGLTPATVYHFKVYEYNGIGFTDANYQTADGTSGNPNSRTTIQAVPTAQPTATFTLTASSESQINGSFTAASGPPTGYIVLRRIGAFTGADDPVDGSSYSVGNPIGSAFVAAVLTHPTNTFSATTLAAAQAYNFRVYAYNGSAAASNYLLTTPLAGSQTTFAAEPTTQAINITFPTANFLQDGTGYRVQWTNGNGARRIVVGRQGADPNTDPTDFTGTYTANAAFGTPAAQLGTGNYIVYDGTGNNVDVTALTPATVYHFKVYEYNGTGFTSANYMTANGTNNPSSRTTIEAVPTAQPTATFTLTASSESQINGSFTAASGPPTGYIVLRRIGAFTGADDPVDGSSYSVGNPIGSAFVAAVLTHPTNTFSATTLAAAQAYNFRVYAYNGSAAAANYLLTTPLAGSQTTFAAEPTTQAINITFPTANFLQNGTGYRVQWTNGNGARRIVVGRQGADPNTDPTDFTGTYTANAAFGTPAAQLGTGNYIVYDGTGNNVDVTALTPATVYHFKVYEYNGTGFTSANYMTANGTNNPSSRTTIEAVPTAQPTATFTLTASSESQINGSFTAASGPPTGYIVLRRIGAFTGADDPVDGSSYSVGNPIGSAFVAAVLTHPTNTFSATTLAAAQAYNFRVYAYNGSAAASNYLLTTPLAGSQTTFAAEPTTQAINITFPTANFLQNGTGYRVQWTNGNGARRIVVGRQGADPNTDPTDFTGTYTANAAFGTPAAQLGTGNYIVYDGTGSNVDVTALTPATVYHFKVYEYNGTGFASANYMTANGTNNPSSRSTLANVPASNSSDISFSLVTTSSITLTWTNGGGANRIVSAHEAAAVDSDPVDGTGYTASSVFSVGGSQIGTGNYVVYNGSSNTVTVTGLQDGTAYYFRIYDYNGSLASSNYTIATPSNNPRSTSTAASGASILSAGAGVEPGSFSSTITSQGASVLNFDFRVQDDGGSGNGSSATQISGIIINRKDLVTGDVDDWTQAIAGAELSGAVQNGPSTIVASTITADQIIFTGIPNGNPSNDFQLGRIDDDASKTFTIKIWLKDPLGGTLPDDIDGKAIVFRITDADFSYNGGSQLAGSQTVESGDANNRVQVVATKININQQPAATAFALVPLAQQPIFEARDANNNRDLDFNQALTVVTSNPANLGGAGAPAAFANGLATFAGFNFTQVGTSTMEVTTASILAAASENSVSITVSGSNESTVSENSFTHPTNILYQNFQAASAGLGSPPPAGMIKVGEFVLQDGGLDNIDADGLATNLTNVTFNVTNPGNIRLLAIVNGANVVATAAGGATAAFSGMSIVAADNGSLVFDLYASFNAPVVDNVHFDLQVSSVTAANTGSVFAFSDGAAGTGGARTSTALTDNLVVVTADRPSFFVQPTNTLIGIPMATVTLRAVDILGSHDLDFPGTATLTSTGVLSTSPTATITGGQGNFSAITHSDRNINRTITATVPELPLATRTVTSSTFNLTASNLADIVREGAFTEPSNILYANFQATDITDLNSVKVAEFSIRDAGGAANDPDGAPSLLRDISFAISNSSALRRVALYDGVTELAEVAAAPTVNFTNLNGGLGYSVPDDGTRNFSIRVTFNNTQALVVDNTQFQFTVSSVANTGATGKSSDYINATAGGASTSTTTDRNRIEAVATKLVVVTQPPATNLVLTNLSSIPVIDARDANDVKDLDYVTNIVVSNSATIPMINLGGGSTVTPLAGTATFPANFQFQDKGTAVTLGLTSGVLAGTNTTGINISYDNNNRINAGPLAEPGTISSITNASPGTSVFDFIIADDNGSGGDGAPTRFNSITITQGTGNDITNWGEAIAGATLTVGGNTLTLPTITNTSITFSGIANAINTDPGYIDDNASKTYVLNVWLRNPLLASLPSTADNLNLVFEVTETGVGLLTTGAPASSDFSAVGTQAQNSGTTNNAINVVASTLVFTSIPGSTSINLPFQPVVVEARDANGNRDLNFVSSVTSVTNNNSLSMINTPVGQNFAAGVLTFPASPPLATLASFQFTSSPAPLAPPTTLSIVAGGLSGGSSGVSVISSTESLLSYVPASFLNRIPYVNIQSDPITNSASSFPLATFLLNDGDGVTNDIDGAATTISTIAFNVTTTNSFLGIPETGGSNDIRKLAIYNSAGVKLAEQPLVGSTVSFSLSPAISAADNGTETFTLRATFKNSAADVRDLDNIRVRVTNVTLSAGSELNTAAGKVTSGTWTKATGAVASGAQTPTSANIVNVVSTQLDFTTQPQATAGQGEPFGSTPNPVIPIVQARDANAILDLEHNFNATLTTGGASLNQTSKFFVDGILSLDGIAYTGTGSVQGIPTGNGTISVLSNAINSAAGPNPCSIVQVYHVTAVAATSGLVGSTSLAGGSKDRVIFGATFNTPYINSGNPKLKEFTISFNNDISTIFENPRIYESADNIYGSSETLLSSGITLTENPTSYRIQFSADKDLSNQALTYFLMVDIKTTASGSSPDVRPFIKDDGYLVPLTNGNIGTTFGSSLADVQGRLYNFSSIFPPTLVSSFPAVGQLDVDPTQPTIDLTFSVPVWTLDQKVTLYRQGRTAPVAILNAANGFPISPPSSNLANPLRFTIPANTLKPDSVYYILIAPGRIDANPALSTGIRDQSGNLFAGISFSGTLYFKTAATTRPPKVLSVIGGQPEAPNPSATALSLAGGSIQATFDQPGKAYYLILNNNATPPSVAQITGVTSYPGAIRQGSFPITQTSTVAQGTSFSANLLPNTNYDVWLSAESYSTKSVLGVVTSTAIPTTNPYRGSSSLFAEGPVVPGFPTLEFTTLSTYPTTVTCNTPTMSICKNSFQILNSPIIINEGSVNNFSGGPQLFFLALPTGFQFDVTTTGSNPKFGNITLSGSDFTAGSGKLSFLSSSVLVVEYANNGSASLDVITISGLRVLVTTNSGGPIVRIGGSGNITQVSQFATLNSFDAPKIGFDNSYSISIGKPATIATPGNPSTAAVTTIPDNFNSPSLRVELIPLPLPGDFGANSFSGAGVNINQLSLSAVNLGIPFNITINHTDNNGCISENPVPYTVYDRNTAIGGLATQYCFTNNNYPQSNGSLIYTPASGTNNYTIAYNNLPAFYMKSLKASLPLNITNATPFGRDKANWGPIIQSNLLVQGTLYAINNPIPGGQYFDYSFDESKILNATSFTSNPAIISPYDYFKGPLSPLGNTYFNGGSLGPIEFEGDYQSIANAALQIPLRQTVDIYLPAIPIIETGVGNRSLLDPITPGDKNPITIEKGTPIYCESNGVISLNGYPAAAAGTSAGNFTLENLADGLLIFANKFSVPTQNAGTNVGGNTQVVLTQKANLAVGDQVEVFGSNVSGLRSIISKLPDNQTYVLNLPFVGGNVVASVSITIPLAGVLDNQNGIGSIDPLLANNLYQPIRVRYTFKENASSCQSSATQTIRITPNPVAAFSQGVLCEDTDVPFTSTSTINPVGGAFSIINYSWNFGDPTSGVNNVSVGSAPINQNPTHRYADGGPKPNVTLQVTSNVGCQSVVVANKTLNIGSTPEVDFSFDGVDVSQNIVFTDKTIIATGGTFSGPYTDGGANDGFRSLLWNYGTTPIPPVTNFSPFREVTQLSTSDNSFSHNYSTAGPGQYLVTLTATSEKGCVSQKSQLIVVLPRVSVSPTSAYREDFESPSGGNWQTIPDPGSLVASSWVRTTTLAGKTSIAIDPSINGSTSTTTRTIWVTNATGSYTSEERSALYSPSFDMSTLLRPMVSFNSFVQFLPSDGLIMQYSVDNKNITDPTKKWNTLGADLGEGIDWFNEQGLGAKPGNQPDKDFGWSGEINRWQDSKHTIINEPLPKDPILLQNRVVFRFAMAALTNTSLKDGFALDNFRFGERTRTILMENFANTSNEQGPGSVKFEKRESDAIKAFNSGSVGTEVVKVNYHTGLPGQDPFNDDNPSDNSARALYYNINFTPDTRLDGRYSGNVLKKYWSEWGQGAFDQQSLQLAQADIVIRAASGAPSQITANGKISGFIDVTPVVDLDDKTILHVAVLEKRVPISSLTTRIPFVKTGETEFEFVLKKLLPNAVGTKTSTKALPADNGKLRAGTMYTFPFEWIPDSKAFYTNKLGLAVFLQNELSKEIYQSEIVDDLDNPTNLVTGLESITPEQVNIYPNPSDQEFTIELPASLRLDAAVRLIDQVGRTHDTGNFAAGKNTKTVSTSGLAGGVYIVEIKGEDGALIRKKVMVVH